MVGVRHRDPFAKDALDVPVGDRHRVIAPITALVLGLQPAAKPAQGDLPGLHEHRLDSLLELVQLEVRCVLRVDGRERYWAVRFDGMLHR